MRTRLIKIICVFSVLTLLFSQCFIFSAEDYNDRRFNTYINMGDNAANSNYAIPHMFRQDAPYTYIEKFPLVVSGGVEYVPLSMFILYPYIEVSYSNFDDNFYLVNNRNGNYISFNVEQNIAETSNGELMKIVTRAFYKIRYVPARPVADALGLVCETYDDPLEGIYAFRISNGKSEKTLTDLLLPYLPKKEEKPPEKDNAQTPSDNKPQVNVPEDKNPNQAETSDPPVTVNPLDPIEMLAPRRLGLCFTGISYENAASVVSTLERNRISASFSFTREEILTKPSLVRELYVKANAIFVTANPDFDAITAQNNTVSPSELELMYANAFVSQLEGANEALKTVLKTKTNVCTLPFNMPAGLAESKIFNDILNNAGYLVFTPNTSCEDSPTYGGSAYGISARLKNAVTGGNAKASFDITALLYMSDLSRYYIADIASLINKYDTLSFFAPDKYDVSKKASQTNEN